MKEIHNLSPERLREILDYNQVTGVVSVRKSKRPLFASTDGSASFTDPQAKKLVKMKLDKIAYVLAYGKYPRRDQRILHRNLNEDDNSLVNLMLVHRNAFLQIKEAHRNLTSALKMKLSEHDQMSYVVTWTDNGAVMTRVVDDIVPARKLMLKLQLKFSKILGKYCIFD